MMVFLAKPMDYSGGLFPSFNVSNKMVNNNTFTERFDYQSFVFVTENQKIYVL